MSKFTRRQFVKTSAAAGIATVAMSSTSRAVQANDKMGVAIVGTGGRGGEHVNGMLNDSRAEILFLVDADENHANQKADTVERKQGSRPKVVTDMRTAFDSKDVDIVTTATPNHWHALCGIWAMQARKDVYIEKPICQTIAEGSALIAAAKKYEQMCQVGTQCRSSEAVIGGMEFIHSGGIGEVNFARGFCWKRRKAIGAKGDYAIPEGVDFNLWSGPAPYTDPKVTRERFHYDWHWQRLYGNGDLGNQGPHQTDIARWGLNLSRHPNSVIAYGGRLGYQHEKNDDNYVDAGDTANTEVSIYDYGDKCIVFETRGLVPTPDVDDEADKLFGGPGNKVGVIFYGSEGYLLQKSYTHCVAFDKDLNVIKEFKGGGDHFGNFLDACANRDASVLNADATEGHYSAAISHLGNISYYLGEHNTVSPETALETLEGIKSLDDNAKTLERTVSHLKANGVDLAKYPISMGPLLKFDPEKEVFPENEEATKMVLREYREGFVCPSADKV